MQYDNYQKKIDKVASVLRYIFKHIVKISIATAIVMAATITVLATKGIIISEGACPETIVYGEKISYKAKAFLSSVQYEFCAYGTEDWSEEEPIMPGKYNVRTVSNASFGGKRYGEAETFTILPKDITVYPSATRVYGDKAIPVSELVYGDSFSACDFNILNVDTETLEETACADSSSIIIVNTNGDDVTKAYNITVAEGKVAVTKRLLTLNIGSKTAVYDGKPLYCEEYEIVEGSVADGNRFELLFDDYAMDVGTVSNDPIISLTDENGNDVREFYQMTVNYGELEVTPRPITVTSADGEFTYDGKEHIQVEGIDVTEGEVAPDQYWILDYATPVVNAGEYDNEITVQIFDRNGKYADVTHNYDITYDYGTLTVKRRPITITTASEEFVYDGVAHNSHNADASDLVNGHSVWCYPPIYPSITFVGSVLNEFECKIIDRLDYDVTNNYEITYDYGTLTVVPRPIIVCTDSLSTMYDGEEHAADGIWVYLDLDKDGNPDLFDYSNDVLYPEVDGDIFPSVAYREGLVPTDALVVSSYTTITNAGIKENVLEIDIVTSIGSVMENYSITYDYGILEVTKRPISIKPSDAQAVYDGQSHGGENIELTSWSLPLVAGHTMSFDGRVVGSRVDAGTSALILEGDCFIFSGEEDVSNNYDITFETGFVEILRRPITVYTGSDEKMYDGTPLTNAEYGVLQYTEIESGDVSMYTNIPAWGDIVWYDLVEGHELILTTDGAITNVGTVENTVSSVLILAGEDDVTNNYDIYFDCGELTVTPRTITVETATNTWVYDDSYHSDPNLRVISDIGLVDTHSLIVIGETYIRNVDSVDNVLEFVVVDRYGSDISYNYEITCEYGTLTVTPRPITIQTDSMSWIYEDVDFVYDSYSVIEGDIIGHHEYWVSEIASIRDVGSKDNVITIEIFNGEEYVTDNYDITYVYGTLTVTPRPITLQTDSMSWLYEDVYFSHESYSIIEGEIIGYHEYRVSEIASIRDVGSKDNVITIEIFSGERDVTDNYEITYVYGTLSVSPRQITVTSGSKSKVYNGSTWSYKKYDISGDGLVASHLSIVFYCTSVREVSIVPNEIVILIFSTERDVTKNYEITYVYGTLEVYEDQAPEDPEETETSGGPEDPEETETSGGGSGGPEDPEETETSGGPEDPEETETSGTPEDPEETETSGGPEDPEETETSGGPEDPEETETSGGPEDPEETETSGGPEDPEETETSGTPEDPEETETSGTPEDPEETETSGGGSGGPEDPEETETSGGPEDPEETETSGTPEDPEETETSGGPEDPEETETSGGPEDPEETETSGGGSGGPEDPEETETSGTPEDPEETETSGGPEDPEETETSGGGSGGPEDPEETETSGGPEDPEETETSGTPEDPEETETSGGPEDPEETETSGDPEDPEETETSGGGSGGPEDPEETETSGGGSGGPEDPEETETSGGGSGGPEDPEETETSGGGSGGPEDPEETETSGGGSGGPEDPEETETSGGGSGGPEDPEETETSGGGSGGPEDPEETETSGGGSGGPEDPEETETSGGGSGGPEDPEETETSGGSEGPEETETSGGGSGGPEDPEETETSGGGSGGPEDPEETETSGGPEDPEETETSGGGSGGPEDPEETETSGGGSGGPEDPEETETSGGGSGGPEDPEETETSGGGSGGPEDPEETETSGGGSGGPEDPEETETSGGGSGGPEDPEETETPDDGSEGNSGQLDLSGNINGGSLGNSDGEMLPSYIIWSTKDGRIYLRMKSFGDYNGRGFNEAEEYPILIDSSFSTLYLSSIALKGRGDVIDVIRIKSMNGQYVLPYYSDPFIGDIVQTSDVIVSGDATDFYELNIYTLNDIADLVISEEYADYERAYRQFVYRNYLAIDSETLTYMQELIAVQGFNKYSGTVINDVANYISHSAIYDLNYDRELDNSENVVVAFLETYKTGICQHYAASAVMLYRALGIPARYTVGYAANANANEWSLVTGMDAHAWVEVYVDEIGWIMVEVTGSGNDFGDMEPEEPKIGFTIYPTYQYKEYDGTPLYAANEISVPFELQELLDRGYSYQVVVSGEQTNIGIGQSYIESFILYDENGNDVTDQFDITYATGSLEVASYVVKILLYQLQKYYDGTPLTFTDEDYEFINGLPDGMKINIDLNISLTDAGYLTMSDINNNISEYITYTVYMNGVPVDDSVILVVDVYEGMSEDYIPIRIDKLDLELTAGSASKNYDGEALENDRVYISKGSLADGDRLIAHAVGSITEKGQALNTIFENEVSIINKNGEDVTANYNITLVDGILTVY